MIADIFYMYLLSLLAYCCFVLSWTTSGTPCLMMPVSTIFIGLYVVFCVLICLFTLGTVLGLVDFYFLSILCVLLILLRLIRATISEFSYLVVLFFCHFIWFYLTCLNLINGECMAKLYGGCC